MLHVPASVAIYVYIAPADLRKGFDGLSGMSVAVKNQAILATGNRPPLMTE
ncbi:MAG TPA: hypothetical protein VGN42_05190 [Pirellulales bacterium]|nr:hypothetical protein [Pirellulales bacterium]